MAATTSSASILPAGHLRQRDIHREQHLERWWVQEILKNGLNTCTRNRGIGQRRDRQGHKSPTPPRLHRSLRWITLSKFHILQQWVYHLGWSRKKSSQGPFSGKWSCLDLGRASSRQGSSPSSSWGRYIQLHHRSFPRAQTEELNYKKSNGKQDSWG